MAKRSKKAPLKKSDSKKHKDNPKKVPNDRYVTIILSAIVIIFAYALFSPTQDFDIVKLDDNQLIDQYHDFNKEIVNISAAFTKTIGTTFYRPVLSISFIIDANIGGTDRAVYHRSNIIFHALACMMVFLALIKLKFSRSMSFIFALIVAAHPLLVPATAWIPGRNDTLITIFSLACFIFFIDFFNHKGKSKWTAYIWHMVFYVIALFTKEIAAFLPFVLFFYSILVLREKLLSKDNLYLIGGWLIFGFIWFLMRSAALVGEPPEALYGLDAVLANYPATFALIGKIFLPIRLIVIANFEPLSIVVGGIVIAAIAVFTFTKPTINKRLIAFAALWFFLLLIPTFFLKWIHTEGFFDYAEHRAYLPLFGILIILGEIFRQLNVKFEETTPRVISIVIIAIFAFMSFNYQKTFENRETFWRHSLEMYPDRARSYEELGVYYYDHNLLSRAKLMLHEGIPLEPDNHRFFSNMANVFAKEKMYDSVYYYSMKTLDLDSNNFVANLNLAKYYSMGTGEREKAIPYIEYMLSERPDLPQKHELYMNLALGYDALGEYEKAIEAFDNALESKPNLVLAYYHKGVIYSKMKENEEAEAAWKNALRLNPKFTEAANKLATLYLTVGKVNEAKAVADNLRKAGGSIDQRLDSEIRRLSFR